MLWKKMRGENAEDARMSCLRDYSVFPKKETTFLLCMREQDGKKFLHIAPKLSISVGADEGDQDEQDD